MFAADTAGQVGACATSTFDGHTDELAHTFLVELLEGVYAQDLLIEVDGQEAGDVVAAIAEGHLREVIRPEAEVLGVASNLVSCERCTRDLDHRTDAEVELNSFFREELTSRVADDLLLLIEFVDDPDQRDHDLGLWVIAFLLELNSGREDSTSLHHRDLRVGVAETTATMAEHRVVFAQRIDATLDLLYRDTHLIGHDLLTSQIVGYELVKWWVEETHIHRVAVH